MKKNIANVEFDMDECEMIENIPGFIPVWKYERSKWHKNQDNEWGMVNFDNVTLKFNAKEKRNEKVHVRDK